MTGRQASRTLQKPTVMMKPLDAAAQVLADCPEPLRAHEITQRMLKRGLWSTTGATPAKTVEARLAVDIKHNGGGSRFVRTAPGMFSLRVRAAHDTAHSRPGSAPVPQRSSGGGALSFTDAAERVLRECAGGKPMPYRVITETALRNGWLLTSGQTPEATLYAQIHTEIERRKARGQQPRFFKLAKGLFGLTEWLPKGLAHEIQEHNRRVKGELPTRLLSMNSSEFEALIGFLLTQMGFEDVTVSQLSRDRGIDVRAVLVVGDVIRIKMAVQAKCWRLQTVSAPVVQSVRGSLGAHDQGLIITTSTFSRGAVEEAKLPDRVPVALMDGTQLVDLLIAHGIGVERAPYDLLNLAPDRLIPGD